MVTQFNKNDMISFAQYVLSEGRRRVVDSQSVTHGSGGSPIESELLREVYENDFPDWKARRNAERSPKPDRKPKQGDILIYHPGEKFDDKRLLENGLEQCTALVTQVFPDSDVVTMIVFNFGGGSFSRLLVPKRSEVTVITGPPYINKPSWSFR